MKQAISIFAVLIIIMLTSFFYIKKKNTPNDKIKAQNITPIKTKIFTPLKLFQTISINHVLIDIIQNDSIHNGDILVLPGWNFNRSKWCDSTSLCKIAIQKGYRLIMPEMSKSIYSTQYYPQTRKDWLNLPNLTLIIDSMIPTLQKTYGIFTTPKNYLVGLSTGARGVLLIALNTDTLFKKAVALSGDYDQTKMRADNLMTAVYGSYYSFKTRWQTIDNPVSICNQLKVPLYLGHGQSDKVVPYSQTQELYDSLRFHNPNLKVVLHNPKSMGHNFTYWNSEVNSIFDFLN